MSVSSLESCCMAYDGNLGQMKLKFGQSENAYTQLDQSQRCALHWACAGGKEEVVDFLVNECAVPVNVSDDTHWTPLMIAASVGNTAIVATLLKHHANTNCVNETGHSALHYAASKNRLKIAELLLDAGASVNIQDKSTGASPLHRAASRGHTDVVKLLLSHGADANATDYQGNSPLHLACEEERMRECDLLVVAGASIEVQNKDQKTPGDLAPPFLAKRIHALAQR